MKRITMLGLGAVVALGMGLAAGCGEKSATEPSVQPAADPAAKEGEAPAESGAGTGSDSAANLADTEIEKNLANLSEADRALVKLQVVCPVTQEPLGSMGAPIKIEKDGKALFICCEGCKEKAEADFAEFIAAIDAKKEK